ncbi:NusA-like transcription termination signal-binding factor [Candidatus Woesearchaeota archaeon]|nr:NusA-like transcription termination signal-binding factor [Candidatus Woesearchaeota archaeon]
MERIKYNSDVMKFMSLFESLTGAKLKDCIANGSIMFIVQESEMGKAIGKKGSNIKRMENLLNKGVRLVEFNGDVCKFVANLVYPSKADDIREEDGIVSIYVRDAKAKGIIIGRDRHRINMLNSVVKRYFDVEEVKVV